MKILHTSDWHLGKKLEGYSRIEEQEKFLEELKEICDKENIDVILVAGDIYDSSNPPVEAERLYFKALKNLSMNGERLIVVIAGNHDNPEKLLASAPFSEEYGIVTFGKPLELKKTGNYGRWEITEAFQGAILVKKDKNELFINALPYPSEKELNEILSSDSKEYSQRIGEILARTHVHKRDNLPSVIIAHLFTLGAQKEGSERDIDLGGSVQFDLNYAPEADYIALGHIHKPMNFERFNAYYSGSPLEYRVSESVFDKRVIIKDLETKEIKTVILANHKAIKTYTASSIEEALEISEKLAEKNEWIYLYIESDRPLKNHETREIKKNRNIIEIIPKIKWADAESFQGDFSELNVAESFKNFYKNKNNLLPSEELLKTFLSLVEELEYETD